MRWKRRERGRGLAVRPFWGSNMLAAGGGGGIVVVPEVVVVAVITIIRMDGRIGIGAGVRKNRNGGGAGVMGARGVVWIMLPPRIDGLDD